MQIAQGRTTIVVVFVVMGSFVAIGVAAVLIVVAAVGPIGTVPTSGLTWQKHSIAMARRVGLCLWS